jgi:hypothetical protein
VRQEPEAPKFSAHPSASDASSKAHKWTLVSFLRIGTLRRHLTELDAIDLSIYRGLFANFHTVPLAAIGHVDEIDAGHQLEQFAD